VDEESDQNNILGKTELDGEGKNGGVHEMMAPVNEMDGGKTCVRNDACESARGNGWQNSWWPEINQH
jgi:hypothetical protein